MAVKLTEAIDKLRTENLSCVVIKGDEVFTSNEFGIKPLMIFLREDREFFNNAVIADKIVGKAAALLMVLGKVNEVYGEVISDGAMQVFRDNKVRYLYEQSVSHIKNRDKTGICPMEEAVKDISSPTQAFEALERTIAALMAAK